MINSRTAFQRMTNLYSIISNAIINIKIEILFMRCIIFRLNEAPLADLSFFQNIR